MPKYIILTFIIFLLSGVALKAQINDTTKYDYIPLTKSSTGAVFRSLAVPGWGQIYVEHYWRSAVFFGGATFLWYNIISNHLDYKDEIKIMENIADKTSMEYQLAKARRNTFVDNRDMSMLYLIGVYAFSMVDAYTGANLFDFDVSDNTKLSLLPYNTSLLGQMSLKNNPYQFSIQLSIFIK